MERDRGYNDESINEFLLQMSDDVLYLNIEEQIEQGVGTDENYFKFILDKIDGIKAVLVKDQDDLKARLDYFRSEVCDTVQEKLENKFGLYCDFKCYSDRSKCLNEIYTFFVLRRKEILLNLLVNYINREYSSLVIKYSKKVNKKDISYINNKKNMNKDDLNIILNIHNIISSIEIPDIETAIDMLIDDKDEFTYSFILSMIQQEELILTDSFIPNLKEELTKETNYLIMEGRIKLMSIFNNR